MIKAVIFDMYETVITHYECPLYFGKQMAFDAGIEEEKFQKTWRATEEERTTGKITFEEILERILKENGCYSESKLKNWYYGRELENQIKSRFVETFFQQLRIIESICQRLMTRKL